jgi:putative peptidoglycan lipid II flippase
MSLKRTLAFATILLLALNGLSRISGFIREMAIAKTYGATSVTDAYIVATTIPNLIFTIGLISLVSVVVPVFTEYEGKGKIEEAWNVSIGILNILIFIMVGMVLLGVLFAPQLVKAFAPGFTQETYSLSVRMTRFIMPSALFMTLGSLFTGILNSKNKFATAAFAPIINNVFIILGVLVLDVFWGSEGLVIGTLAGSIMFAAGQIPAMIKQGFRYRFSANINHPGIKKVFRLMGPVTIGVAVNQMYLIIDKILASGLAEGSISALQYASKVMQLPLNIFVLAVSSAFFPTMSKLAASNDSKSLASVLNQAIGVIIMFTVPAATGLIVLREPIIKVLFERGAFNSNATQMTAVALMFFSFGILGQAMNIILTRGYFSLQDTKTPIKITILGVVINIIASIILVKFLSHAGLALANSIAATVSSLVMFIYLSRRIKGILDYDNLKILGSTVISAVVMGVLSATLWNYINNVAIILRLGFTVLFSIGIYAVLIAVFERKRLIKYTRNIRTTKA